MKYLNEIQEFFDETGLSKEVLLECINNSILIAQPWALDTLRLGEWSNVSDVKKMLGTILETQDRNYLADKFPHIFSKKSNHNYDADILNILKPLFSIERKNTFAYSWTFGQKSKETRKIYVPFTLLVQVQMLSFEQQKASNFEQIFRLKYASFAYIPEHPNHNFSKKQSKEFSIELFSM